MPQDPVDRDPKAPDGEIPHNGPESGASVPIDVELDGEDAGPPAPPPEPGDFDESPRTQALSLEDVELLEDLEEDVSAEQAPTVNMPRLPTLPPPSPPPSEPPVSDPDSMEVEAEFVSTSTQALTLDDAAVEVLSAGGVAPAVAPTPEPEPEPEPKAEADAPPAPEAVAEASTDAETELHTEDVVEPPPLVEAPVRAVEPPNPPTPPPVPPAPPAAPPAAPPEATVSALLAELVADAHSSDWKARADELRGELDAEADKARSAFLAYELGELSEVRLRDEAGAVKLFGRALQADPSLRPNLWSIRRVFYRRALWPNLLKLLDAEIRFARDDADRADLYVEKGQILEDRLKSRDAAREAFDRALALSPSCVPALLCRERIALKERDDAALERVWRALADATVSPARKVAYLLDLARLQAVRGEAGAQAALEVIAEAVAVGADRERVARERERIAELAGDAEAILGALEARAALAAEPFGPGGPAPASEAEGETAGRADRLRAELIALRRRQAQVVGEAGDPSRAWGYLEQAAALAPGEPLLVMDLADHAEDGDRFEELAGLCARLASMETDPARALALGLRRADALARAGKLEEADGVLDAIVAAAPGYLPVTALRERRALEAGNWERIAALYVAEAAAARLGTIFGPDQNAAAPDPRWAAAAYVAAGDVYDVRLGRPEDARIAYGQALEACPGHPPAVAALAALHERAGRLDEACALLEEQARAEGASPAAVEELLERLARRYEDLDRPEDALRAVARLAERRPDDATLRWRLADLLAAAGRTEERAALFERLAEKEEDPLRRGALALEIALIYDEELDRPERAAEMYRVAIQAAPQDRYARAALAALLRRTGRWEELVAERRAEAEAAGEGAGVVRALREAAAILERKLGRPADAAAIYRELADRAPDDPAALRGLASTLSDQPAELAPVLERELALAPAGPTAGRVLVKTGELYEHLGRAADAAAAYRRAAEAGAEAHAHWALACLAAGSRDDAALVEALSALFAGRADDEIRADLLEEVAWLSTAEAETAAARFEELVGLAPERHGAQLGRALLAARRRDPSELAAALTALADRTTDPTVGAALLLRAATLAEVAGVPGGGAELAARAHALRPEDGGAVLAAAERAPAGGVTLARRIDLLERRAAMVQDPEARADLELERAVELERAGRLADAGRVLHAVLTSYPDHLGAWHALRRVARRGGDGETLARASYRLGQLLEDPESAAGVLAEAARLLEGELAKPRQAAGVWRAVLERTPLDDDAYGRAHDLLCADGDNAALYELLSHRLRHVGEPAEEIPYRLERAALRLKRREHGGAGHDLEKILEIDPNHLEALSQLADVRIAADDAPAAAQLLERYLEVATDPAQVAEAELRLAAVLAEKMDDAEGAVRALEKVLEAAPERTDARRRLIQVLEGSRQFERAAEELHRMGAQRGDRFERAKDELQAAVLYRQHLHDAARARRSLERARTLDPLNLDVVRELVALAEGQERAAALMAALADVRGAILEYPTRVPLFERLHAIGGLAGEEDVQRFAAGALTALGAAVPAGGPRASTASAKVPGRALTGDDWRFRLEHPGVRGALADFWPSIAESAARLGPHEPAHLGFTKSDRVAPKMIGVKFPALEAWLRAAGLGELDLYVAAARSGYARTLALETPVLLLSGDVARAETPAARFALGRVLCEAHQRSGAIEDLPDAELALLLAAAMKLAGGNPATVPALAAAATQRGLDDRAKALGKVISRKDKKALPLALGRLPEVAELAPWRAAVRATARRVGLLVCGDLAVALAQATPARGAAEIGGDPAAIDLITFATGEEHLVLRRELGL